MAVLVTGGAGYLRRPTAVVPHEGGRDVVGLGHPPHPPIAPADAPRRGPVFNAGAAA